MTGDLSPAARRWLGRIPDEPLWVDLRGFLLSGRAEVVEGEGDGESAVVLFMDEPVAFVIGSPGETEFARLGRSDAGGVVEVLAPIADAEHLADRFPGWERDDAVLHRLAAGVALDGTAPSGAGVEIALVMPEERERVESGNLPEELLHELIRAWNRGRPVACAFVDGRAVSFLTAAVETERHWDVVVETLDGFRRRGLAGACFGALHPWFSGQGKEPVWGAHGSNAASLALARRLGFVPCGRLAAFVSPDAPWAG